MNHSHSLELKKLTATLEQITTTKQRLHLQDQRMQEPFFNFNRSVPRLK